MVVGSTVMHCQDCHMLRQCFCIRIAQACDSGKKFALCVCVSVCVWGLCCFAFLWTTPLKKKF